MGCSGSLVILLLKGDGEVLDFLHKVQNSGATAHSFDFIICKLAPLALFSLPDYNTVFSNYERYQDVLLSPIHVAPCMEVLDRLQTMKSL